jgi:hypothetical protein
MKITVRNVVNPKPRPESIRGVESELYPDYFNQCKIMTSIWNEKRSLKITVENAKERRYYLVQ